MTKTCFTLLTCFFISSAFSQNVNYTTEIVEFYMTGCDDGAGSDEEPTWKVYTRDNISTGWEGGTCHFTDGNIPIVYIPSSGTVITSKSNTAATLIDVRFEAWEDDCDGGSGADRCNFDASCLAGIQEDDCLQYHDPLAGPFGAYSSIDFRNDPDCSWNTYTFSAGDFGVKIRIRWEYTDFTAGTNVDTCGNTINLSGAGSGEWTVGSGTGGTFADQTDPTTTFLGTAGQSYVLEWNTLAGCPTTNSDNITVNLFTNPVPQLEADQNPLCEGEDITFTAQEGIQYDFSINALTNVMQSSGSDTYVHTTIGASDSIAFVVVTNSDGCSVSDTLVLDVLPKPTPSITRTGSDLTTGVYPFYQWYYNGTLIGGATSQSYTATANGNYTVQVVGTNGCVGESSPEVITNVGITDITEGSFSVFPNPAEGTIYITSEENQYKVCLKTLTGKTIAFFDNAKELDVSHLSNGMYVVMYSSDKTRSSRKLIIQ